MVGKSTNKGTWERGGVYTQDPPAKIFMSEFGASPRCKRSSVKLAFYLFALLLKKKIILGLGI